MSLLIVMLAGVYCEPKPGMVGDKEDGARLWREGADLLEVGNFGGALQKLQAACEKNPVPEIVVNIGLALNGLNRKVEALEAFEQALAGVLRTQLRTEVKKLVEKLRREVGVLEITVNEPHAEVIVDEVPIGESPMGPWRVEPGSRLVTARKPGYEETSENVRVAPGQSQSVRLFLTPSRAYTGVGAVVRLDGDRELKGGAAAVGFTYAPAMWIEFGAVAIIGPEHGARLAGSVLPLPRGLWKPFVSLGIPVFFIEGARPGFHGGAGIRFDPMKTFGILIEAAVEHFPTIPVPFEKTVFVPSLGIQARFP